MALEIERKFLVKPDFLDELKNGFEIKQGYLSLDINRTVRIRIQDRKGFITIKGKSNKNGLSRFEWEKEIEINDALNLLKLSVANLIEKTRYRIPAGKHIFELDVFKGENKGLIIAEIELQTENEPFIKPIWLGSEVSGKSDYYNLNLAQNPFSSWI